MNLQVYSQTGEEGVLDEIFAHLGEGGRFLVDLGAGDGRTLSNTRLYLDRGWQGVRFDLVDVPAEGVRGVALTAENVGAELAAASVPTAFDLLSLDIDGVDWYVLRAVLRDGYRPRVVCVEINPTLPAAPGVVIAYDAAHRFDETHYFGGSLQAFMMLAEAYGYTCVRVHEALNAFFVRTELLPAGWQTPLAFTPRPSWPVDPQRRPWVTVTPELCR